MKSWTSIPFYLWKNTFRRWLEHPVSPFGKMLVPALLGFLALLVLGLFRGVERELSERLERHSVFTVVSSELIQGERAATLLDRSLEEEALWQARYPGRVFQLRQPLISAGREGRSLPVLAYTASLEELHGKEDGTEPPVVWLLGPTTAGSGRAERVDFNGLAVHARTREVPEWLARELGMEQAVAVAIEAVAGSLRRGFILHTVARLRDTEEVGRFVREAGAYYRAEGRQVKLISAAGLLEDLERIQRMQALARTWIVVACGVILALTLGSVAWLEYRQEAYLLALLRSFGSSAPLLFFHMLLENLLLVLAGLAAAAGIWVVAGERLPAQWSAGGLSLGGLGELAAADAVVLLAAALSGLVLAMVPVAVGMRKPPGLILQ
jgi:hypothetical protein